MQVFRNKLNQVGTSLPHRQGWHNLSAFITKTEDANEWRNLRNRDTAVQNTVDRYNQKDIKFNDIKWEYWNNTIGHQNIVKCLRSFYEHQTELIDSVLKVNHREFVKSQTEGWELFEQAVASCEKSVEKSEALVANGARALWVSANNPPARSIDTNEWVESDLYWQAYIEKHHFYNPNPTSNDPELPSEIEGFKKAWHTKVGTFNDRAEIPQLHSYMEQYPSWEYYDIHRRAFLEHMCYYLIRSGGTHHFFPEVPSWQWLIEIENLRHRFISVAQRRRTHFQLLHEERARSLDLQPLDSEHDGEEYYLKFIQTECRMYDNMIGRLMGNFMFLCHPFIPVQSLLALNKATAVDGGEGVVYMIGEDVNALFYLPATHNNHQIPTPREGLNSVMDHFTMTARRFNPTYATLLDIYTTLLEKRGKHWYNIPGETVCDAFMRRLRKDDPAYEVYRMYVGELKERFENATVVSNEKLLQQIKEIEKQKEEEDVAYQNILYATNSDFYSEMRSHVDKFNQLNSSNQLQQLMNSGSYVIIDGKGDATKNAGDVVAEFSKMEEEQAILLDFMKSIKPLGSQKKA